MELILIVVLALMVFGPAKLPEIMGQIGKGINDFRRATSDLSDEFNRTIQAEMAETKALVDEAKSVMTDTKSVFTEAKTAVTDVHASVNSTLTGMPAPVRIAAPGEGLTTPDALAAPNGTSSEPHTETNGTASAETTVPLANTSQWSWETAAPAAETPPVAEAGDAAAAPEPASAESPSPPAAAPESGPTAPSETPGTRERTARDELQPPY
jgi:TatA/E family protein of Tat protein translocase